jgi:hypothetical protein
MSATQGRDLPKFPINDETKAAIRHALGTSITITEIGERTKVGGDFTLNELLDFYSGADETRSTLVGYGELIPGIEAPIFEMWDPRYSVEDIICALLDALDEA